jgi:beta-glucosidase
MDVPRIFRALGLGAVGLGAAAVISAASAPATARAAPADTLTVVTLNLWHDQREWPRRLDRIVRELRGLRPDVVFLQEVLQHEKLPNQARTLADSLGYAMRFASVDGPERPKRYGNAVLTPHRVLATGERNLSPDNDYRVVAHVRLEWRGRAVDAYSTHLHHTPEGGAIRATQIRHLLAWIDSTRGDGPVVLAGDFNAELGTPEMELVTARYTDAFQAVHPQATREESVTFNRRFGPDPGKIDHVFVETKARSIALRPVASEVLFRSVGPDSVWASDHFGVLAKLRAVK